MNRSDLHSTLREQTAELHRALDNGVGDLTSMGDYHRYLKGSAVFRMTVEPWLLNRGSWELVPLCPALRSDLNDLGLDAAPLANAPVLPDLDDISTQAGALYVLEGSAMGARLIARQAAQLGLGPDRGAAHLSIQVGGRWPQFRDWLAEQDIDAGRAAAAAQHVFRTALKSWNLQDQPA